MQFVVCGEALIDLVPDEGGDTFRTPWSALSAGGPVNTAIGLARLGERVQFAGRLSTDRFGRQLRAHLAAGGVGLEQSVDSDDPTPLAVVSVGADGSATYAFHFDRTAAFGWRAAELPAVDQGDWLHVASLATVVDPGAGALLPWVDAHTGPLSFDINVRPTVIADPEDYWRRVQPWLEVLGRHGGVVRGSDEDIDFLAGASGETGTPESVLRAWRDRFGFGVAVVTTGASGAWGCDAQGEGRVPGRPVEVVDTVGAGDTFTAALLAEYARSGDLHAALDEGVAAGAYACGRRGPQPPTRAELEAFLER
ncbi:carbohydrate kinase [Ammonicoccus fulvus]|uniref:Carbohydrate kinase n=1 Tax=Ammonicoccus fulvus TaxID=3138240 RepID=A0ABZ3FQP1_9ACTN